jgi:SAM-dependent methyltransferase
MIGCGMSIFQLPGPLFSPISGGGAPEPSKSASGEIPKIIAAESLSIEDGILFGIAECSRVGGPIELELKKVVLTIELGDTPAAIFSRYKEHEFDAHAADYELKFIQRNIAMYAVAAETLRRVGGTFSDPLRMLDIACGTGFALREAYVGRASGKYFGIDSAEKMLGALTKTAKTFPDVEVTTRLAKAGILSIDSVQQEILSELGGRPQLICWIAAMHVINKHDPLGPLLEASRSMLDERGRVVVGNYFHRSQADFEAFRHRYVDVAKMLHQPTPPAQLFTPEQMEAVLRAHWLQVESCEEVLCTDGLRAYVMVAKHRNPDPTVG